MGLLWIQRSGDRVSHIPVIGDDVNTPSNPIDVSMVQAVAINRYYSDPIVVNHPTLGQFTISFMPEGITGSCNQCGHCCTHLVADCPNPGNCNWAYRSDIDCHACPHLVVDKVQKFPQANNTYCDVYQTILNVFKGCAYPPDVIKTEWINCGYSEI